MSLTDEVPYPASYHLSMRGSLAPSGADMDLNGF